MLMSGDPNSNLIYKEIVCSGKKPKCLLSTSISLLGSLSNILDVTPSPTHFCVFCSRGHHCWDKSGQELICLYSTALRTRLTMPCTFQGFLLTHIWRDFCLRALRLTHVKTGALLLQTNTIMSKPPQCNANFHPICYYRTVPGTFLTWSGVRRWPLSLSSWKAALIGANTVKGPSVIRVWVSPTVSTSESSVENLPASNIHQILRIE